MYQELHKWEIIHLRMALVFIFTDGLSYKEHTSTHVEGTDPKVALGA